eukprot:268671_1
MEFWATTNHKLRDYKTVITATDSSESENSFGNVVIKSTSKEAHKWKFKVLRSDWSNGLYFGIVMNSHLDVKPVFTLNGYGYGLCSDGSIYSANSKGKHHKIIEKNLKTAHEIQKINENDIICMTLDLNKRILSFHINNKKNKSIIINNIKVTKRTNYKMAVYTMGEGDEIQLLKYINHNNIEHCCVGDMDEKENEQKEQETKEENESEIAHIETEAKTLTAEKLETESNVIIETVSEITERDNKIELLQNELTEIKIKSYQYLTENKELQTKLKEQSDIILKLEQEINGYKIKMGELNELKIKNGILIEEKNVLIEKIEKLEIKMKQSEITEHNVKIEKCKMLNMQNESLSAEQKELEIENKRLFVKYKKLKIENMNVSKYASWDWFDIFVWIITIENKRFSKYEKDLHIILSEEQPTGHDLEYVNETDAKRWGVTNFGDIHALCENIKELIKKHSMFVFLDK